MAYNTTREEAQREAAKIVAQLPLKKGWKPDVWNNLGWCYCARCKRRDGETWQVWHNGKGKDAYWASVHIGGLQFHANGATAMEALNNALQHARDLAKAILAEVL